MHSVLTVDHDVAAANHSVLAPAKDTHAIVPDAAEEREVSHLEGNRDAGNPLAIACQDFDRAPGGGVDLPHGPASPAGAAPESADKGQRNIAAQRNHSRQNPARGADRQIDGRATDVDVLDFVVFTFPGNDRDAPASGICEVKLLAAACHSDAVGDRGAGVRNR